jgi:hypothetical protein
MAEAWKASGSTSFSSQDVYNNPTAITAEGSVKGKQRSHGSSIKHKSHSSLSGDSGIVKPKQSKSRNGERNSIHLNFVFGRDLRVFGTSVGPTL